MTAQNLQERALRVRTLLRQRAARGATGPESPEHPSEQADVHPDNVLARLDSVAKRMPESEIGDPAKFRKAFATLLKYGDSGLKKILLPTSAVLPDINADELASAEALVIADGTRPSFLLREGTFAEDHPFLGSWRDDMINLRPALRKLSACVGRIQLPQGGPANYNGTGTLVDVDQGLVLTNFHVVNHARSVSGVKMEGHSQVLQVKSPWVIDFIAESGSTERSRWRVREVRLPAGAGVSFDGLDAAVLCIEPFDPKEGELPAPAVLLSGDPDYATGAGATKLLTIGFPGEPDQGTPPGAVIDWNVVIRDIFNNRFGVKRVAPGKFLLPIGSVPGDTRGHILAHDATTFGGASGSLLFAFKDAGQPAFALHFAGATLSANFAASLFKAKAALSALGLKIT